MLMQRFTLFSVNCKKHWPNSFTDICVLFSGACLPLTNIHNRLGVFSFTSLPNQEMIGLDYWSDAQLHLDRTSLSVGPSIILSIRPSSCFR